jgi:lipopolysaccharide export system permease protein
MGAFDRYIFRTTFGAFLLICISLTALIWLTHALREIDLMTNQRQTVLVFVGHHRLADSDAGAGHRADRAGHCGRSHAQPAQYRFGNRRDERVRHVAVAHLPPVPDHDHRGLGAGARRQRLPGAEGPARTAHLGHQGQGGLRHQHRAAGRFITIERGLTFHIRERRNDGQLLGIFIDDRRDEKERVTSLPNTARSSNRHRHVPAADERRVHRLEAGASTRPS